MRQSPTLHPALIHQEAHVAQFFRLPDELQRYCPQHTIHLGLNGTLITIGSKGPASTVGNTIKGRIKELKEIFDHRLRLFSSPYQVGINSIVVGEIQTIKNTWGVGTNGNRLGSHDFHQRGTGSHACRYSLDKIAHIYSFCHTVKISMRDDARMSNRNQRSFFPN